MINSVVLQGRLTKDPTLRTTQSGMAVCTFGLAVDDGYGEKKQTIFIDVTVWGKTGESTAKYARKGNMVGVVGRLTQRKYTNRAGVEVSATEVTASQVEFMTPKSAAAETPNAAAAEVQKPVAKNTQAIEVNDDDLPF